MIFKYFSFVDKLNFKLNFTNLEKYLTCFYRRYFSLYEVLKTNISKWKGCTNID